MDTRFDRRSPSESVWIVGHDGSEHARHAALWAVAHAPGRVSEVRLVTAWHVPADTYLPAPGPYLTHLPDDLAAAAERSVVQLADSLRPVAGVDVTTAVVCGGAARSILESAPGSDAVVIGARGRGGFARLVLGSTSTQVATHATVPTIVVPTDASVDRAERILVAVDGSPNSLAAYEWALRFAGPEARIESLHVRELPFFVTDAVPIDLVGDVDEAETELHRRLEALDAHLAPASPPRHHVVEGQVRHELARRAAEADLLVMGARGHGAISAAILGSVSTWLLHHLHLPMAIVPAPEPDESGAS